jgi:hypothetical protein
MAQLGRKGQQDRQVLTAESDHRGRRDYKDQQD